VRAETERWGPLERLRPGFRQVSLDVPTGVAVGRRVPGGAVLLRAGRVVEIRVWRLADAADVQCLNARVFEATQLAGRGKAVICADYRRASPLPRPIASAWSRAMRMANRAIDRSAVLLDPANILFNLQFERMVRCAGNPARRLFMDAGALCEWVGGCLTRVECDSLDRFFVEEGGR